MYTIDIVSDGEQLLVMPIYSYEPAELYEANLHTLATSLDYRDDAERTIRMIREGDVIHEATVRNGEILASF